MVVQHNLTAMNSNRLLGLTTASQAKSTEKLSSGYKINRAADDASGLAISEKMRKQIRGLTQASANAEDGISAVQTAEGALTEVHDMLQRMNELAVKAANETQSKDDRDYIQSEVDQLVTEIDRVATTTKFNEIYLLKGTNTTKAEGVDARGVSSYETASANLTASLGEVDASGKIKLAGKVSTDKITVTFADDTTISTTVTQYAINVNGTDTITFSFAEGTKELTSVAGGTDGYNFNSMDDLLKAVKAEIAKIDTANDVMSVERSTDEEGKPSIVISTFADLNAGLSTGLHVGADSTDDNKIGLNIQAMSARSLGINGIRVDGGNGNNATASIDTISNAIKRVSSQRSELGAVQNRLEHTISNLDNIVENTSAAESAIRDTDMASEMVKYSNYNILAQAGQSMLAQANQSNQGVLSLLG